jgi:phenylpyruvate tautomerase PptA (4-oxalocrotonate tautomerase family)
MPRSTSTIQREHFPENAIDSLADEITNYAQKLEKLPNTPYVRSNIWVYAKEYAADRVYHGGKAGGTKVISFEVNVIEGGLDAEAKKQLIAFLTEAVRKHAGIPLEELVPLFVLIRDVPDQNWGMFGKPVTLDALRNPPANATPV